MEIREFCEIFAVRFLLKQVNRSNRFPAFTFNRLTFQSMQPPACGSVLKFLYPLHRNWSPNWQAESRKTGFGIFNRCLAKIQAWPSAGKKVPDSMQI